MLWAENRHGLIVDAETAQATSTAEVEPGKTLVQRSAPKGVSAGGDEGYGQKSFVAGLLELGIKPQRARKPAVRSMDGPPGVKGMR